MGKWGQRKETSAHHLNFGGRIGKKTDYPSEGQWRWQAGWIKLCPQDLGWLQPSLVIASQDIHFGDTRGSIPGIWIRGQGERLATGVYLLIGVVVLLLGVR